MGWTATLVVAGFGLVFCVWLWAGQPWVKCFCFGLDSPVFCYWLWARQPCVFWLALGWTALCFVAGFGLDSPVFRCWLWAGQPCVFWLALGWTALCFVAGFGLDSPVFFVGFGPWAGQPCVLLLALGWTALCFLLALGWTALSFCWLWAGQPLGPYRVVAGFGLDSPVFCCCLGTLWFLVAFGLDSPGLKLFACLRISPCQRKGVEPGGHLCLK